jgi:hypothetical protein
MDLLDALAGNTGADSIAELSNGPLFPRSYNSIYKAIKASFNTTNKDTNQEEEVEIEQEKPNNLIRVVSELIDQPQQHPFYLFALDTTPHPRPYARTLAERGYIYQPNTINGITLGQWEQWNKNGDGRVILIRCCCNSKEAK